MSTNSAQTQPTFKAGENRPATYAREDAFRHLEAIADSPDAVFSFRVIPEHPHLVALRPRPRFRYNYRGTYAKLEQTLIRRNLEGCAIFFTPNQTDGRGVKKINITRARTVVLDLDGSPLPTIWPVAPHVIVETSAGRYQATWCIRPTIDIQAAEDVAKRLAVHYHGDPNVFDAAHVFRLAGFAHQKRGPYRSTLIAIREFEPRVSLDKLDASLPRIQAPPTRKASSNVGVLNARAARLLFEHLSIDAIDDNSKWLGFAMALHSACNGDDEVAELFFEFCAQDPRYANQADDMQNRMRWESFDARKPGGITIRTLERLCREHRLPGGVLFAVFNDAVAVARDFENE
ncbi:DNA-primase RepB domain-containing protein [Tardiphaga sp. 804_B3_N1_9]|uniref:DNA-primase RepB domain-containing protein n=1 Tax=Tardiphaga sp. 804_B3_N1_9 TaxID=3240786 RepID=UPI003F28320C